MNVHVSTGPTTPLVTAASQLALMHTNDFAALGASDLGVSNTGVELGFANPGAAGVAAALLRDHVSVAVDAGFVEVPIAIVGAPTKSAAIEDVAQAIRHLNGVASVIVDQGAKQITVGTPNIGDAERLDRILRRDVLDFGSVYDNGVVPDKQHGWGSGVS